MRGDLASALRFAAFAAFAAPVAAGCRDRIPTPAATTTADAATCAEDAGAPPPPDPFREHETPFALQPHTTKPAFRPDPAPPRDRAKTWPRVDHLDVAYTLKTAPAETTEVVADHFVVTTEGGAWIGDARTGARERELKSWPKNAMSRAHGAALSAGEGVGLVLRQEGGSVEAYDPKTGTRRFIAELYTKSELALRPTDEARDDVSPRASIAASTGSVVVLSVTWRPDPALNSGPACEHIGLDAADGQLLWRLKTQYECRTVTAAAGRVVILQDARLVSLDAGTGRVLWEKLGNDPENAALSYLEGRRPLAANERFVALWGSRDEPDLIVLDATSGALIAKGRPFGPPRIELADVAIDGPRLHALVETEANSRRFLTLTSVDLATARRAWQAPPVEQWIAHNALGTLIVDDDAVFACTPDGMLRGHDSTNGKVLWSWGVGNCGYVDALRLANAPATLLVQVPTGIAGFVRGPRMPPSFRMIVDGSVSILGQESVAVSVRVGPVLARANANGGFRTEVRGRGFLRIEPWLAAGCDSCDEIVVLDGSQTVVKKTFSFISDGP